METSRHTDRERLDECWAHGDGRRVGWVILAAVIAVLAIAPAADASGLEFGLGGLAYNAAAGENNHLTVAYSAGGGPADGTYTFADSGAAITALPPCMSLDVHRAACP